MDASVPLLQHQNVINLALIATLWGFFHLITETLIKESEFKKIDTILILNSMKLPSFFNFLKISLIKISSAISDIADYKLNHNQTNLKSKHILFGEAQYVFSALILLSPLTAIACIQAIYTGDFIESILPIKPLLYIFSVILFIPIYSKNKHRTCLWVIFIISFIESFFYWLMMLFQRQLENRPAFPLLQSQDYFYAFQLIGSYTYLILILNICIIIGAARYALMSIKHGLTKRSTIRFLAFYLIVFSNYIATPLIVENLKDLAQKTFIYDRAYQNLQFPVYLWDLLDIIFKTIFFIPAIIPIIIIISWLIIRISIALKVDHFMGKLIFLIVDRKILRLCISFSFTVIAIKLAAHL